MNEIIIIIQINGVIFHSLALNYGESKGEI